MSQKPQQPISEIVLTPEQLKLKSEFKLKYATGPSPLQTANIFQKLFFTWCNPILKISQFLPFESDMLYTVPAQNRCEVESVQFTKNFQHFLNQHKSEIDRTKYLDESKKPNILLRAIFKTYKWKII